MYRFYFLFSILFVSLLSCLSDSENLPIPNGFTLNGQFYEINNVYHFNDRTTSQNDDFFIHFTDGRIISVDQDTNELVFDENTSNLITFKAIQNPNTPTALNFPPDGPYQFNSDNELLENISLKFNCQSTMDSLNQCESIIEINSMDNSVGTILEIQDEPSFDYTFNFMFELSDGQLLEGQFNGELSYPIE